MAEQLSETTNNSIIQYDLIEHKYHSVSPIIFIGNGNRDFGERVAKYFPGCLSDCIIGRFSDGEIKIPHINENIRRRDCIIIQSCAPSTRGSINDLYMELQVLIDALKRANANSITVILPIFPYQRQDRKPCSRAPITAALVARTLEMLGISRVICFDLHAGQIQGFFSHNTPLDNLYTESYFIEYIRKLNINDTDYNANMVVVSPDEGGVKRASRVADKLGCSMAVLYKDRTAPNIVGKMLLMGNVADKIAIIIDDMVDTAGTACKAAQLLHDNGAKDIYLCACHGVLSGDAIKKINESMIKKVVVSNTIEIIERFENTDKIDILDVSELCASAIERALTGSSISELMNLN